MKRKIQSEEQRRRTLQRVNRSSTPWHDDEKHSIFCNEQESFSASPGTGSDGEAEEQRERHSGDIKTKHRLERFS